MKNRDFAKQLEAIASADDFVSAAAELMDSWSAAGVGAESIEPILRFMEMHPDLDYGMPGPLVHYIEDFDTKTYDVTLIESVKRRPTMMTVWMINRILNTTESPAEREPLVQSLRQAAKKSNADQVSRELAGEFLAEL